MSLNLQNVTRFFHGESLASIFKDQGIREQNKTIDDIYHYDDYSLEADHSFIQWIFPTPRASVYNGNAPVLSMEDIAILKKDPKVINWLNAFKSKMFDYFGISPKNYDKSRILNGHNGLRLSRAIECLTLFGIEVADIFDDIKDIIERGYVRPYCEVYDDKTLPIWFIRYKEAASKLR